MTLRQRIERTDGSQRTVPLRATLRYVRSSDHSHWHVLGFMRYELRNADGVRLVRDRKTGFCLGDRYRVEQSLPGRAPSARARTAAARCAGCCGSGKESRSAGATTPPTSRARSSTSRGFQRAGT